MSKAQTALRRGDPMPELDDDELTSMLDNTWCDTGRAIISNWLGLVYQLTNLDRRLQYMDGVDPEDPLRMKNTL